MTAPADELGVVMFRRIQHESLILAQNERWRQA